MVRHSQAQSGTLRDGQIDDDVDRKNRRVNAGMVYRSSVTNDLTTLDSNRKKNRMGQQWHMLKQAHGLNAA
jgi:hypothetical protein